LSIVVVSVMIIFRPRSLPDKAPPFADR